MAGLMLIALAILDHCGVFRRVENDRSKYGNAVAIVTHVPDGDTLDIDIPDGDRNFTRIRLWGVDCPEISHQPDQIDEWFGREAADFVQEHLDGRRIRVALDPNRKTRGKYGRLLAYVYLDDGDEMLNEVLLQEGLAYADRRFDHIFKLRFRDLEARASKAGRGLWDGVTIDRMPAWRQRMLNAGVIRGR